MADKMRMFQYAVILHKTEVKDGKTDYVGAEIIIEPKIILARNEKEVLFKATREIPEDKTDNPDNIDIIIRNF